ncbi:MAG: hypothetical protein Q9187_006624, partial [Circinaria calcarea]
ISRANRRAHDAQEGLRQANFQNADNVKFKEAQFNEILRALKQDLENEQRQRKNIDDAHANQVTMLQNELQALKLRESTTGAADELRKSLVEMEGRNLQQAEQLQHYDQLRNGIGRELQSIQQKNNVAREDLEAVKASHEKLTGLIGTLDTDLDDVSLKTIKKYVQGIREENRDLIDRRERAQQSGEQACIGVSEFAARHLHRDDVAPANGANHFCSSWIMGIRGPLDRLLIKDIDLQQQSVQVQSREHSLNFDNQQPKYVKSPKMSWNPGPSDWDTGAAADGDGWDTGTATNGDGWDTGVANNDGANNKGSDTAGATATNNEAKGEWSANAAATTNGDFTGGKAGYSGGDARMHAANGDFESGAGGGGGGGDSCHNCGGSGHYAADCPEPRKQSGNCFNCDQPGHNKADCPNERVERPFTGICRVCQKEGHPAALCPEKQPETCRNCKKEGHKALDCKDNRLLDWSKVADKTPEDAWEGMKVADADRDLDDLREAVKVYVKAVPDTTYEQLERAYRQMTFQVHLIASEKEVTDTFTLVNFQGKQDCKYTVGYFFSDKPPRSFLKEGWPASPEENLVRLRDAGIPMDRGVPKCGNCNELGHIAKHCKEEKAVVDRVEVKCVNCEEIGHRARDCTKARTDRYACRNCKSKCSESVRLKTLGNPVILLRNVPNPVPLKGLSARNVTRLVISPRTVQPEVAELAVTAMGHTIKRCKQPAAADGGAGNSGFDNAGFEPVSETVASGGEWETGATGSGDWDTGAVATGVAW